MNERSNIMFRHMQWDFYLQLLTPEIKEVPLPVPKHWYDMTFAGYATKDDVVIGIAVCSKTDNYTKEDGRDYAEERVIHNPAFTFPKLHKSDKMAVYYWISVLVNRMENDDDGRAVKNHVARLQRAFDKTEKGVMLKKARQRKEVLVAEQIAFNEERKLKEKAARAEEYKEKFS